MKFHIRFSVSRLPVVLSTQLSNQVHLQSHFFCSEVHVDAEIGLFALALYVYPELFSDLPFKRLTYTLFNPSSWPTPFFLFSYQFFFCVLFLLSLCFSTLLTHFPCSFSVCFVLCLKKKRVAVVSLLFQNELLCNFATLMPIKLHKHLLTKRMLMI